MAPANSAQRGHEAAECRTVNRLDQSAPSSTNSRQFQHTGDGVTALKRRLVLILVICAACFLRVSSADTLAPSSSAGFLEPIAAGDDDDLPVPLSSVEQYRRHLFEIIVNLLQKGDQPEAGVKGHRIPPQLQQLADGFEYGPAQSVAAALGMEDVQDENGQEMMVDDNGMQWRLQPELLQGDALNIGRGGGGRAILGRRQGSAAAKRGPGVCINSCMTGGMTFVRCKSMCH